MVTCSGAAVHESRSSGEIVYVIGDIDQHNVDELEQVLESVLLLGRPIQIDLTRCRYIGSIGLRTLLRAQRRAAGFSTVIHAGGVAARLLEIAKVEERLGVRHVPGTLRDTMGTQDERDSPFVIALDGEWDLSRGNELREQIERGLVHPRVIIDLTGVSYIDSYCVGMLVRARTQRVVKGYEPPRLVLTSGNVRRVLGIVSASSLWTMYETVEEALRDWQYPGNNSAAHPS